MRAWFGQVNQWSRFTVNCKGDSVLVGGGVSIGRLCGSGISQQCGRYWQTATGDCELVGVSSVHCDGLGVWSLDGSGVVDDSASHVNLMTSPSV